jgi:hypothetical protein
MRAGDGYSSERLTSRSDSGRTVRIIQLRVEQDIGVS